MDSVKYKVLRDEYALGIDTQDTAPEIKPTEEPEIVEGMISPGLTVMVNKHFAGMGWLTLQLAMALAEGKPFLGHKTTRRDVLYCTYKCAYKSVELLPKRAHMLGAAIPDNMLISGDHRQGDDLIRFLEGWMEQHAGGVVILDSFYRAKGVAVGENYFVGHLLGLAIKYNTAIIVSHHPKVGEEEGASHVLVNAASTLMKLERREKEGVLEWKGHTVPDGEIDLYFTPSWTVKA